METKVIKDGNLAARYRKKKKEAKITCKFISCDFTLSGQNLFLHHYMEDKGHLTTNPLHYIFELILQALISRSCT